MKLHHDSLGPKRKKPRPGEVMRTLREHDEQKAAATPISSYCSMNR
ncbi:hypothetical protein ACIBUR_23080 [Streptomyces anulatus]